jgi:hypothetical protein
MDNKSKGIDLSFVKIFERMMNYHSVLLLIYGIFLFDSLDIIFFRKGLIDTDFSVFFNLSAIPFFLLFLVSFGIIVTILSSLVHLYFFKFCMFLSSKFGSYRFWSVLFNSKPNNTKNFMPISSLYEIALIKENTFLLEYIESEIKRIQNAKKYHRIIYSLLISLIFNFFVMIYYNNKTIIDFIICLYKDDLCIFIKICLTLLIIPVILTLFFGLKHSVEFDDNKIYFPDDKYNSLINKNM